MRRPPLTEGGGIHVHSMEGDRRVQGGYGGREKGKYYYHSMTLPTVIHNACRGGVIYREYTVC